MLQGKAIHKSHVVGALIVGAVGHLLLQPVEPTFHLHVVGKRLARLLANGGVVGELHHLRQIAYGGVIGDGNHTRGGLLQATKNFEQGRLARTILAYQGNAVMVVDHKTNIVEEWTNAKLYLKVFYRNHLSQLQFDMQSYKK